jgi:hypothetical protein
LPKKSCCIDIPVIPGIMIGSLGRVLVRVQVSVKIPGLRAPDGKPVVSTGAEEDAPPAAVPDDPELEIAAPDADGDGDDADDADADADARLTATTDETAAADAAARTTAPAAATIRRGRVMNMSPVNVRESRPSRGFTLPEQRSSTAPTFG